MTTHSSILAWEISWTQKPGGLSMGVAKESDTTEQLTLPLSHTHTHRTIFQVSHTHTYMHTQNIIMDTHTQNIIMDPMISLDKLLNHSIIHIAFTNYLLCGRCFRYKSNQKRENPCTCPLVFFEA